MRSIIRILEKTNKLEQFQGKIAQKSNSPNGPNISENATVRSNVSYSSVAAAKPKQQMPNTESKETKNESYNDFNTLIKEVNELNNMFNIKELINKVKMLKSQLSKAISSIIKPNGPTMNKENPIY